MPELRRNRSAVIILTLVSVSLLTLGYRQGATGPLALVQRGAITVVAPVQEGFVRLVRPIGGLFTSIGQLGRLRVENEALRADLEQVDQRQVSLAELERENTELRKLLDMEERFQLTTVSARVIAPPPGALEWRVLIDIGAEQGVTTGMAVVNPDGLVGRVSEVTADYAWVELAASPTAGYAVRIAQNGETGALSGRGPQPYQLEVYDTEAELPSDAEIITQAYEGSRIPDGIPVGGVVSPPGGLAQGTRFVEVRPYVDFTALDAVLVVLNALPQPTALAPAEVIVDPNPPRPPSLKAREAVTEGDDAKETSNSGDGDG